MTAGMRDRPAFTCTNGPRAGSALHRRDRDMPAPERPYPAQIVTAKFQGKATRNVSDSAACPWPGGRYNLERFSVSKRAGAHCRTERGDTASFHQRCREAHGGTCRQVSSFSLQRRVTEWSFHLSNSEWQACRGCEKWFCDATLEFVTLLSENCR